MLSRVCLMQYLLYTRPNGSLLFKCDAAFAAFEEKTNSICAKAERPGSL